MNLKICSAIYLVVLCVVIATNNAVPFSISKTGVVTADVQCSAAQDKEKCTLELCKQQYPNAFECAALDCKLRTPANKEAILDCVYGVCALKNHDVCEGITQCEKVRAADPVRGQAKYIICITKLFICDLGYSL